MYFFIVTAERICYDHQNACEMTNMDLKLDMKVKADTPLLNHQPEDSTTCDTMDACVQTTQLDENENHFLPETKHNQQNTDAGFQEKDNITVDIYENPALLHPTDSQCGLSSNQNSLKNTSFMSFSQYVTPCDNYEGPASFPQDDNTILKEVVVESNGTFDTKLNKLHNHKDRKFSRSKSTTLSAGDCISPIRGGAVSSNHSETPTSFQTTSCQEWKLSGESNHNREYTKEICVETNPHVSSSRQNSLLKPCGELPTNNSPVSLEQAGYGTRMPIGEVLDVIDR